MRSIATGLAGLAAALALGPWAPPAARADDRGGEVLILAESVHGGLASLEAAEVRALGLAPVLATDAQWRAMGTEDFARYRALVLGDPRCGEAGGAGAGGYLDAAEANAGVWARAAEGNVIAFATDPAYHEAHGPKGGPRRFVRAALSFAAAAGRTGAAISLSCYYHAVPLDAPVRPAVLAGFGGFLVTGAPAHFPNDAHLVARHAALADLADADLARWWASAHGGFLAWPPAFRPVAVARDGPAVFESSDGARGLVYVLARGEGLAPAGCGDGRVRGEEECDPADPTGGDLCGSDCRLREDALCGCLDRDGDGWSAPYLRCASNASRALGLDPCTAPVDCDDTNPLAHPFAEEIPGTGLAESCVGRFGCASVEGRSTARDKLSALLPLAALLGFRRLRVGRRS